MPFYRYICAEDVLEGDEIEDNHEVFRVYSIVRKPGWIAFAGRPFNASTGKFNVDASVAHEVDEGERMLLLHRPDPFMGPEVPGYARRFTSSQIGTACGAIAYGNSIDRVRDILSGQGVEPEDHKDLLKWASYLVMTRGLAFRDALG